MKKIILIFSLLVGYSTAQCLGAPLTTRIGIKLGINPGFYNYDDGLDKFTGTGFHIGFGMGTDFMSLISLDMTPQWRSTSYGRDEVLGYHSYSYTNIYFPIFIALKGGLIPVVSPYLGLGLGINIRASGKERLEFNNGTAIEDDIGGGGVSGIGIFALGLEFKFLNFRVPLEFTANINGSADDPNTENRTEENIDYHISTGFYYSH